MLIHLQSHCVYRNGRNWNQCRSSWTSYRCKYSVPGKKTYSGGSYEKRAMKTQQRPFPGMSSMSTWGSPLPFNASPWRANSKIICFCCGCCCCWCCVILFYKREGDMRASDVHCNEDDDEGSDVCFVYVCDWRCINVWEKWKIRKTKQWKREKKTIHQTLPMSYGTCNHSVLWNGSSILEKKSIRQFWSQGFFRNKNQFNFNSNLLEEWERKVKDEITDPLNRCRCVPMWNAIRLQILFIPFIRFNRSRFSLFSRDLEIILLMYLFTHPLHIKMWKNESVQRNQPVNFTRHIYSSDHLRRVQSKATCRFRMKIKWKWRKIVFCSGS